MTREDLSFVADALLALCEKPADRPFYSEAKILQKLRRAEVRDPIFGGLAVGRGDDPLLAVECRDVFAQARLTERQSEVLSKRLEGWTFEEIGRSSGHSKQGAMNVFVQAVKKIARSFRVYPFKGLSEVYREEVRRGARRAGAGKICGPAS